MREQIETQLGAIWNNIECPEVLTEHEASEAILKFMLPNLVHIGNYSDFLHEIAIENLEGCYKTEWDFQEAYNTEVEALSELYFVVDFGDLDLIFEVA